MKIIQFSILSSWWWKLRQNTFAFDLLRMVSRKNLNYEHSLNLHANYIWILLRLHVCYYDISNSQDSLSSTWANLRISLILFNRHSDTDILYISNVLTKKTLLKEEKHKWVNKEWLNYAVWLKVYHMNIFAKHDQSA